MVGAERPDLPPAVASAVNRIIDERDVRSVFLPLVHLATGEVVGYEALTRGPENSPVEAPRALLEAARSLGRLHELDWACAAEACRAALAASLHPSTTLFVNIDPETLLTPVPEDLRALTRRALDQLRIVVDVEERSVLENPSRMLAALAAVRETGWGAAVDHAEADPTALALLPVVHPDVVKLDLRAMHDDLDRIAAVGDEARAYAEQSGATLLAQGIERDVEVALAEMAGATFGQGYYYGRPAPLPRERVVPRSVFPLLPPPPDSGAGTPYELVTAARPPGTTTRHLLCSLSRHLEEQAAGNGPPALLVVSFQLGARADPATRRRLARLGARAAFTATIGGAVDLDEGPTVRADELDPASSMRDDWNVVVLGPHYAAALVARDLGDVGPSSERRYSYALSHDRELVTATAQLLLRRIARRR
ncbi:MAG: EAL domain-containing protein [Actinomycetota bacterium]|nr:EAL domain-containing protein [Actinomycetota bacterium]